MKIVTIVGTRPQFIKGAVVSRAIARHNQLLKASPHIAGNSTSIKELIIHTGQHFDYKMSDIFFDEMEIPWPHCDLGIHKLSHGAMTGRMIEAIEALLKNEKPHLAMVYGDSNSTLAGALAAVKLHIPVAHVEAGLRSFNRAMPEEQNRIMTDHVSTYLFCPTQTAVDNLKREGLGNHPVGADSRRCPRIFLTGDVMYDAALFYAQKSAAKSKIFLGSLAALRNRSFALVTLHRAENTDSKERLSSILDALDTISREINIIWPMHPRSALKVQEHSLSVAALNRNMQVIDPVGYFDMLELLKHCSVVLTDSGGLQKEAYFFAKPCITLRDETEWVELREHGFNSVVGSTTQRIVEAFQEMFHRAVAPAWTKLYGSGTAGEKIVSILAQCPQGLHSGCESP